MAGMTEGNHVITKVPLIAAIFVEVGNLSFIYTTDLWTTYRCDLYRVRYKAVKIH